MEQHIEGQTIRGKQLLQCGSSAAAKAMNLACVKMDEQRADFDQLVMDFRQAFDDESFGDAGGLVSRAESRIDRTTADVKGRIAIFVAAQALFTFLGIRPLGQRHARWPEKQRDNAWSRCPAEARARAQASFRPGRRRQRCRMN